MNLPPFMSASRLQKLCDWPTSDRRRIARRLSLVAADGREIDFRDPAEFWNSVLDPFFLSPRDHRTLIAELPSRSNKYVKRSPYSKAFDILISLVRFERFNKGDNINEFLNNVISSSIVKSAILELAEWIWAAWLAGLLSQEMLNQAIDDNEELGCLFGSWRAAVEQTSSDEVGLTIDSAMLAEVSESEDPIELFSQVRFHLEEAERTDAVGPLLAASATIERLIAIALDRSEGVEQLNLARAKARNTIESIQQRRAPVDPQAAERLRQSITSFSDILQDLGCIALEDASDKLVDLVILADSACEGWRVADDAYHGALFDKELRDKCFKMLDSYQSAEENIVIYLDNIYKTSQLGSQQGVDRPARETPVPKGFTCCGLEEDGLAARLGDEAIQSECDAIIHSALDQEVEGTPTKPEFLQVEPTERLLTEGSQNHIETVHQINPDQFTECKQESIGTYYIDKSIPIGSTDFEEYVVTESAKDASVDAGLTLASALLWRANIGLFDVACSAGAYLKYQTPHPALARLLGLSGLSDSESQFRFTQALQFLLEDGKSKPLHLGESWLKFAALSLPAILDSTLQCRTALDEIRLDDRTPAEVRTLQSIIVSLDRTYPSVEIFAKLSTPGAENEFQESQSALREYISQLKGSTLAYQAATVVAHKLAQEFEKVAAITLADGDGDGLQDAIRTILPDYETDLDIIRRLDHEARGGSAERKPIEARALTRLREVFKELRALSARLLQAARLLREHRNSNSQRIEATRRKGSELHRRFMTAAESFAAISEGAFPDRDFLTACAHIAAKLLISHAEALETGLALNPFQIALKLDRFRLESSARQPESNPEQAWEALRFIAQAPSTDWLEVFDNAMRRRDHLASAALLETAQTLALERSLDAERLEAIESSRRFVETERATLQDNLLTVMNYAPVGETSLDALYQGVAQINVKDLPRSDAAEDFTIGDMTILDFPDALAEINTAKKSVQIVRLRTLKGLEERIARIEKSAPTDIVISLKNLVASDDLITLAEELTLVERGQDIKVVPSGPLALEEFAKFLKSVGGGGFTLQAWAQSQSFADEMRASALIRKWLALRTSQGESQKRCLRDVLGEIGFVPGEDPVRLDGSAIPGRIRQFGVKLRVFADREFCSVSRFGSEAEGRYRVIVPAADTRPNEIVTAVLEGDAGATLVFVQKWLTSEERRSIATEARRLGRAFCLIDDGLLAFLCTRQRILHDLFACGIPFGAANPYVTTPGSIPVEAFFGREAEFDEIRRRSGSCIVYGGRQLGKSVLLDQIEKRNRGNDNTILVRLDCQNLSSKRDILALVDKKVRPALANPRDDILVAIEKWLDQDSERSILLMLDETNSFVRADALRNFEVLIDFRGLMERTNRRFKVVLSGQNNVLRLAHQPNTPLAHFGQPICIGPLKGSDYKSARDLVTEPLAAVGYVFESPQLVSRILVETQFYPKLVQMFCRDLLGHLRGMPQIHSTLPPWKISNEHIEATLRNQRLRKEIFETFRITLDLDKRYELVALIMAVERVDRRKKCDFVMSMTEQQLRQAAFYWWREGFSDSNAREDFRGVLEELEGLGVLMQDREAGNYQLSSPIIANLIGSEAEIYDRLVAFANEPSQREIEPSKRRSRLLSMNELKHRGLWLEPLTPAQISRATRAIEFGHSEPRPMVLFGAPDMLLDQVKAALEPRRYDEHEGLRIEIVEKVASAASLARQLQQGKDKRRCLVIPQQLLWDFAWVEAAGQSNRENAIVFLGNLAHGWRLIVENPRARSQLASVRLETLAPMSKSEIEDQLHRRKLKLSDGDLNQLLDETGGFLHAVGNWTDRHQSSKRDTPTGQEICPRLDPLPLGARSVLSNLVHYILPEDVFDIGVLTDCCGDYDPTRVFDFLAMTGLAEPVVREKEYLKLNRVFWSRAMRKALLTPNDTLS